MNEQKIHRAARLVFSAYADKTPEQAKADGLNPISQLQLDLSTWQARSFVGNTPERMALGMSEEGGELFDALTDLFLKAIVALKAGGAIGRACHAVLKSGQRIREMGDPEKASAAVADAVADVWIFMFQLCTMFKIDAGTVLFATAARVMGRDWAAHPDDADVVAAAAERT